MLARSFAFLRGLLTPDPSREPFVVVFHHRALLFWLIDAVTEAFVHDHFYRHSAVLQRLTQFVCVWNRNSSIKFTVLYQRWGLRILDVRDRRGLSINLGIVPRRRFEVLSRERMDVSVYIVRHPVRDPGAN